MPQFDFYSFSGQNFWILLSFFVLYFFILYFYLANFSEMFKMRQKLIDAEIFNRARIKGQTSDWKEIDGRDFVAKGDGKCFVSMQQVDSRDRGKNWGGTRCGKTDSESMMDRVNADFESRKNPPKTQ